MRTIAYDDEALLQFDPVVQEAILRLSRQQEEIANRKPEAYQAPPVTIISRGPTKEEHDARMASQTGADGAKVGLDLAEGDHPWRIPKD